MGWHSDKIVEKTFTAMTDTFLSTKLEEGNDDRMRPNIFF